MQKPMKNVSEQEYRDLVRLDKTFYGFIENLNKAQISHFLRDKKEKTALMQIEEAYVKPNAQSVHLARAIKILEHGDELIAAIDQLNAKPDYANAWRQEWTESISLRNAYSEFLKEFKICDKITFERR
ncbi:hypothetical protein IKF15_04085 [Candidatus Saccharibacteria bacterium]|nr:hypothetical protein [Candidatus Saccharibacteria bacterium]